jgi:hypothetical protein
MNHAVVENHNNMKHYLDGILSERLGLPEDNDCMVANVCKWQHAPRRNCSEAMTGIPTEDLFLGLKKKHWRIEAVNCGGPQHPMKAWANLADYRELILGLKAIRQESEKSSGQEARMFWHTDVVILWTASVKRRGICEAGSNTKEPAGTNMREERVQRAKRLIQVLEDIKQGDAIEPPIVRSGNTFTDHFDIAGGGRFGRCCRWLDSLTEELVWKLTQKRPCIAAEIQHCPALGEG